MKTVVYNDFEKIVLNQTPLIDVRAPIEFKKGAFINTVNLPLMNDEERHLVGICYKEKGNEEAVKLGYELVSGDIRQARITAWQNHIKNNPETMIYCFRGGQRSQISQEWIKEATGEQILRLDGGYKAFRNYLMEQLEPSALISTPILLGGCTGSGKTILLKKLKNAIDLEGIANHRGSSFGSKITPQPTPINFENNLAYALINHKHQGFKNMILEDEGRNVGARFLPQPLAAHFHSGNLVVLKVPIEERVEITMDEYVYQSQEDYCQVYADEVALSQWADYIRESVMKIKKRFGEESCKEILAVFEQAYQEQLRTGSPKKHRDWIEIMLRDYYDPMYNYQIQKTTHEIIFEGNTNEVLEFLKSQER
ncbi:MAG TPA: tRNA 2-selenouridine(34) synthase MnmH [Epulopiscium sp.]|nr:tRNA 2-selenouridine(34) synthase MnmH [Candidatus Epulonipiscium sp.]